ncbi:hypothetical protein SteCoe_9619 [Stentor coeruleus]|uniref:Uncharacterized protein n=1 Tax=Stentor coeruleus TaxID=5963 RepID=A0A1R2CHH8_9CILI|nr:hypothetical protein SteCoe_9619 [Stentor coeruleus]
MESRKQKRSLVKDSQGEPKSEESARNLEESKKPIINPRGTFENLTIDERIDTFDEEIQFIFDKLSQLAAYIKTLQDDLAKSKKENKEKFADLASEEQEMKKTVSKIDKKMSDLEKKSDQLRQKFESRIEKSINENNNKELELRQKLESKIESKIEKINAEILKIQKQLSSIDINYIEDIIKESKLTCNKLENKISKIEVYKKEIDGGMKTFETGIKKEINALEVGMKKEMNAFEIEIKKEMKDFKNEIVSEIGNMENRLNKRYLDTLSEFERRVFAELERVIIVLTGLSNKNS